MPKVTRSKSFNDLKLFISICGKISTALTATYEARPGNKFQLSISFRHLEKLRKSGYSTAVKQ